MSQTETVLISGQEDLDTDPYSLTIIVEDTKTFTKYELIKSVVQAVARFTPVPAHMEPGGNFDIWNQGRFRKLLKRMKPKYFEKLPAELKENKVTYGRFSEGNIRLVVIEPLRKSFTLPVLKRAQVSGLTVIDENSEGNSVSSNARTYGKAEIVLNKSLNMSISKATIAAAHAFQILRDHLFDNDKNAYESVMRTMPVNIVWRNIDKDTADSEFVSVIRDAGLTEVEPGSITAAAKMTGSVFLR